MHTCLVPSQAPVRLPTVAQAHFDPQRVAKYGATCPAQVHERRRLPPHDEADARDQQGIRRYGAEGVVIGELHPTSPDRKSTRLNSSHSQISYAVFCLKKKTRLSRVSDKP